MFTAEQKAELEAPLNRKHVKSRSQAGRSLSYIEGWHAIAEANRIFGFDGWARETLEFRVVSEREREIGRDKRQGWAVTYIAKVRVEVYAPGERATIIAREGCGTGHGIDVDLGQAHESALKEAETDAMKRALMTFGNPFGLALYDKEQANIADTEHQPEEDATLAACLKAMKWAKTPEELKRWHDKNRSVFQTLSNPDYAKLVAEYKQCKLDLEAKMAATP